MKKEFLTVIGTALLFSTSLNAQNCAVPPTCESLGYNMSEAECTDLHVLRCPFDQSKIYCSAAICPDEYNLTSCPVAARCDWCGNKAKISACEQGFNFKNNQCIACQFCTDSYGSGYMRWTGIYSNSETAPACDMSIPAIKFKIIYSCSSSPKNVNLAYKTVMITYSTQEECLRAYENKSFFIQALKNENICLE